MSVRAYLAARAVEQESQATLAVTSGALHAAVDKASPTVVFGARCGGSSPACARPGAGVSWAG